MSRYQSPSKPIAARKADTLEKPIKLIKLKNRNRADAHKWAKPVRLSAGM